jgi:two-component system NtrC family sensor kinase
MNVLSTESLSGAETVAILKQQLATVRVRVGRLRDELLAANQQARLSHQLTLLGQFTAGFLHEFNNPLAIVTNRIEILLDERKADAELCLDLQQMLRETRYMGTIAQTLLRALRRERGAEVFEPCLPAEAIAEAVSAMSPVANNAKVQIVVEEAEAPRVNLPSHVISEVLRGLIANALNALSGRPDGIIWVRLEPYRTAGARVLLRVEDNGPGLPAAVRAHLFEPFVSQSVGRERLGLGLFLAASLLDTHEGALKYEDRPGGGARFLLQMPPARFTRDQPYHWFVKEGQE